MTGTRGRVVIEYSSGSVPPTEEEMKELERIVTKYLNRLHFTSVDMCWEG